MSVLRVLQCQSYPIFFGNAYEALDQFLSKKNYNKRFVLVDENTHLHCLSRMDFEDVEIIKIKAGETEKNISTCNNIWEKLVQQGADRKSVLINLGGGVIGDMGGFCASTYMRGIDFIQVPTTLLSQVDASVGSKLGVDHHGFKNMIGVFKNPQTVIIDTSFLNTLSKRQYKSGFAEIIKHALIQDADLFYQVEQGVQMDLEDLVYRNVAIKKNVVERDPNEMGLRKILNFGHSIGHAIETALLGTPAELLHGEAIAVGMIIESIWAHEKGILGAAQMSQIVDFIQQYYDDHIPKKISDPSLILDHMKYDKKNESGQKMLSVVNYIGHCLYNKKATDAEILKVIESFNKIYE